MKYFIIVFSLLFLFSTKLAAQSYFEEEPVDSRRNSITIGLLNGGGSLIGADFETLLSDRLGLQIGAGIVGFGAGINFHLKPTIRSSFFSLQYWNQGVGDSFAQSVLGPNFVFRGAKWFTFQIGYGAVIERGPAYPDSAARASAILLYSIGAYFPL